MHACDERAFLVAQTGREVPPARFVTGGSHTYEDGSGKEKKGFALYPGTEARVLSINVTGSGTDCSGNNEECWKKGFLWRKMWQLYLAGRLRSGAGEGHHRKAPLTSVYVSISCEQQRTLSLPTPPHTHAQAPSPRLRWMQLD